METLKRIDMGMTPAEVAHEVGIRKDNKKLSPAERHVRSLGCDFFMVSEVAEVLGISPATVRKLIPNDDLDAPSFWVRFGDKAQIYLYTAQDVQELRDYLDGIRKVRPLSPTGQRLGRPHKYTPEQRKEKRKEYNRRYYEARKAARKEGIDESSS